MTVKSTDIAFAPHYINVTIEAKASWSKNGLKQWHGGEHGENCNLLINTFPPSKYHSLSAQFHGDHKAVTESGKSGKTKFFEMLQDSKQCCLTSSVLSVAFSNT